MNKTIKIEKELQKDGVNVHITFADGEKITEL